MAMNGSQRPRAETRMNGRGPPFHPDRTAGVSRTRRVGVAGRGSDRVVALDGRNLRPRRLRGGFHRTSGGAWRTLQGLADFAIVRSYLDTANKWGIDILDALRQLFTTGPCNPQHWPPAE